MAKRIIECQVSDEYVLGAGVVVGAAGSHNDVILRLSFGDMWAGLDIYATFLDARGEKYTVVLLNRTTMLVPGTTMTYDLPVPAEAKKYEGQITFTLSGYLLGTVTIETGSNTSSRSYEAQATVSAAAHFKVLPSKAALLEDMSVTPTIAQQLQSEINSLDERADGLDERADGLDARVDEIENEYVTEIDLDARLLERDVELNKRLNNYVKKNSDIGRGRVYGVDDQGQQTLFSISTGSLDMFKGDIPSYNANRQLATDTPTENMHATNKKYVDDLVGGIGEALDGIIALQNSLIGGDGV